MGHYNENMYLSPKSHQLCLSTQPSQFSHTLDRSAAPKFSFPQPFYTAEWNSAGKKKSDCEVPKCKGKDYYLHTPGVYWGVFPKEKIFHKANPFLTWVSCKLDYLLKLSWTFMSHLGTNKSLLVQTFTGFKYSYRNFFLGLIHALGRKRKSNK